MNDTRSSSKLVVVILNWNKCQDTIDCVRALEKQDMSDFSILVVDNGSRDGSAEILRSTFPEMTIICNSTNLGYAGGNNVGIRAALDGGADLVLLLNNDAFPEPDFLRTLVQAARTDDKAAALGGKVIWDVEPPRLWGAYGLITYHANIVRIEGWMAEDISAFSEPKQVDFVIGCGIMMTRRALEDVGLLDEDYFAYHEDADWCLRAKQKGYHILYIPDAMLRHKGSHSTGGGYRSPIMYFGARNSVLFAKKHATLLQLVAFACFFGWDFVKETTRFLLRRPHCALPLKLAGAIDGVLGNHPPLKRLGLE